MRTPILLLWLSLPLAAWAYHEGPGQDGLKLDEVDSYLVKADAAVAQEDWDAANKNYEAALQAFPDDDGDSSRVDIRRRIQLAINQIRLQNEQLPQAQKALANLTDELKADANADPETMQKALTAQANAQYYITWLMRLEGYTREEWEPEIEVARQTYRLLAERADKSGKKIASAERREDLEASIALARMDLQELQGLPLPSQ